MGFEPKLAVGFEVDVSAGLAPKATVGFGAYVSADLTPLKRLFAPGAVVEVSLGGAPKVSFKS